MKTENVVIKNGNSSFNRMITINLDERVDIRKQKEDFANAILNNCPVHIYFNKVKNTLDCNMVLAFLEGVVYAIGGDIFHISDESYLFGSKEAYDDGSLLKWVKNNGRIKEK